MPSNILASHPAAQRARLLLVMSLDESGIGRRIAQAREAKGWTQLDFAHHANVSPSSVSRWERGKLPPLREIIRVAGVLEVDATYLVEGEASEEQPVATSGDVWAELRSLRALVEDLGRRLPEPPDSQEPPEDQRSSGT